MTDRPSGDGVKENGAVRGEFGRIRDFFAPLTGGHPDTFGLLDDAALLSVPDGKELVVTMDTIVRHVHFLGKDSPEDIGAKLLRVNLSDLAAKGADPVAYSLSLALPSTVDDSWVEAFAGSLAREQDRFGIRLLGGDSVRTDGPEVLTITAYGSVPRGGMMLRSGAKPGDAIYVSGTIGDGALGLMAARGAFGAVPGVETLARRYRIPEPRLDLGRHVRSLVNGAMDISDGLVGDLAAMCVASGTGARLASGDLPLSDPAIEILAVDPDLMETVLTGGDDYELLLSVPAENIAAFNGAAERADTIVTKVGEMTGSSRPGEVQVLGPDGEQIELHHLKFTHG